MNKQFVTSLILSGLFLVGFNTNAQIKLLKGVRDNMMDNANMDLGLAKYEIDKVMQHPDTRDMCAAWAWKGVVYSEIANSGDTAIKALDKTNTAAQEAGEAFLKFFSCSEEEQDKVDAKTAANLYLVSAISACWNIAAAAGREKGSFNIIKTHMDLVDKMIAYDVEEKAKNQNVTREQALYAIWRAAYMDSLVDVEVTYLERLMAIPTYMNATVFIRMAEILSDKKQYDKALEYLDKGKLKIPQKAGDFLNMQINIEIERENMVALLAKFNEAINENPENPQYFFSRGVAYHKLKEDELKAQEQANKSGGKVAASKYFFIQGLNDYKKAIELDPGYFGALKNEAILLFDSANYIYKMRIRVPANEYDKYDKLAISLYKQALEKFERIRESGLLKDEELIDALKDMKTICIKINDEANKLKYDALLKSEKKKLEEKTE